MTEFSKFNLFDYLTTVEECHAYIEAGEEMITELAAKYDDAMKRIQDMQAELDFLRREVNRG